jgi:magnesium transporter
MSALSMLATAYAEEHPLEVARLLEDAEPSERARLLEALERATAARVLAETTPRLAAEALDALNAEDAAEIIAQLEPHAAAVLLLRLQKERADALLDRLRPARRAHLRTLVQYRPMRAGGRVDPRALGVPQDVLVSEAVQRLLREPDGVSHYVYVVGEHQQLTGVINLRELMGAPGDALLESVMVRNPERLRAEDSLERIAQHPAWRRLHALPVVDEGGRYLGALRYSAFRTIETELGQAASGVDSGKSAAALAELYSVGGGALLQWASMALTPPDDRKRGGSS